MPIEQSIPLLDDILATWKSELGVDYTGYKNHVYRMVNFCFALGDFNGEDREKIIIAGCFHDIGIWTAGTFDYLPPSVAAAQDYLTQNSLAAWAPEIASMIDQHHRLRKIEDSEHPTIEAFRRGDLVDFSLGTLKCGLSRSYVNDVRSQFPNAGFHKTLVKTAARWVCRHPLNPVPVLKW